jgi:hypothetical protein
VSGVEDASLVLERLLLQRDGLLDAPLLAGDDRQVVHRGERVTMLLAIGLQPGLEDLAVQVLCLAEATLREPGRR